MRARCQGRSTLRCYAGEFGAVCAITDSAAETDTALTRNTGRSLQGDRTVKVFPAGDGLAAIEWHPFVKTIIRVTRHTLLGSAATGLWEQRGEVACYLSSAMGLVAIQWCEGAVNRKMRYSMAGMRWRRSWT